MNQTAAFLDMLLTDNKPGWRTKVKINGMEVAFKLDMCAEVMAILERNVGSTREAIVVTIGLALPWPSPAQQKLLGTVLLSPQSQELSLLTSSFGGGLAQK